jgi:hypothetical protein
LGTKYLVVLCAGSTLPLAKQSLDEAPYKLSEAVAKLAGITFSRISSSYWINNLLLGFPTGRSFTSLITRQTSSLALFITAPSTSFSGAVAGD